MTAPSQPILFTIPANPVPQGTEAGFVRHEGGARIRYALVPATGGTVKGTVLVLTGRNEAIEKYFETARDLRVRGFAVIIMDWRGQGGSDRLLRNPERGFVQDFGHYVEDLERVIEEVALPRAPSPYFVLAHSTGSLVALLAAPRIGAHVQRMVLTSALLEIKGFPISHAAIRRLSGAIAGIGLGRTYLGGGPRPKQAAGFSGNPLTHDAIRFARNAELLRLHPHLGLGGPTAAWVRAACLAIDRVHNPDFIASVRVPMLFVAAGADPIVSSRAIEAYAPRLRAGSAVSIAGALHELPQEANRFR